MHEFFRAFSWDISLPQAGEGGPSKMVDEDVHLHMLTIKISLCKKAYSSVTLRVPPSLT